MKVIKTGVYRINLDRITYVEETKVTAIQDYSVHIHFDGNDRPTVILTGKQAVDFMALYDHAVDVI